MAEKGKTAGRKRSLPILLISIALLAQFGLEDISYAAALDGVQPSRSSSPAASNEGNIQVAAGFFERLFKRRSKKSKTSVPSKKRRGKKKRVRSKKTTKKRSRAVASAPVVQTIKKDPDAAVIAVFGDEFSQDMAWGLQAAFAKTPDVKVEIHSVARTGLIYRAKRNPLFDPFELVAKKPYSFAVVMIGLNDRVKMPAKKNEEGEQIYPEYDFKSDGWQRSYGREIDRIRLAFAEQEKPVYWVGLPPVSNKKLSADMLFFNDFVSARLTERGERFIDIWDAFSNEDGDYSRRGPDLNGQEKRLRQKNGIRFNKAGRRKLAFFVEKRVIRALSQSVEEDVLPENLATADEEALREGRGASRDIFVLRKPSVDSEKLVDPASFSVAVAADGEDRPGGRPFERTPDLRVDDFSWNGGN